MRNDGSYILATRVYERRRRLLNVDRFNGIIKMCDAVYYTVDTRENLYNLSQHILLRIETIYTAFLVFNEFKTLGWSLLEETH